MFTFDPLYRLQLGNSKMVKESLVLFVSSESVLVNERGASSEGKLLWHLRRAGLRLRNKLLWPIKTPVRVLD